MESSGLCGMHFTKERGEEGGNPIHFRLPARCVLFHESMSWLCLGRDTVERVYIGGTGVARPAARGKLLSRTHAIREVGTCVGARCNPSPFGIYFFSNQQRCFPCIPSSGPGLNGCCWTTTVAALLGDVSTPAPCFSFLLWP